MGAGVKDRNRRILALRGKKSFALIAKELRVSRSTVAGVMWRDSWDGYELVRSPNSRGSRNKCGVGRHGGGEYAAQTMGHGGRS